VAIAFRAVGALTGADSGNVASIGLPAGHTTDDILLLVANQFDNVASTVAGYTLVASATNGSTCAVRIFAKRDNGAESAPTLTHAAGGVVSCWIAAYSGVPNTLTVGTGAGSIIRDVQNSTGTGNTQTTPALSGLISGDMRLTLIGQTGSDTSGGATVNYSPSVGFTERIDNGRISATTGHAVGTIDDFLSSSSAGTTQAGNATGFAGTVSWIGFQLALASSAGAASVPLGDPQLFNELSGPGVDYGPYAFIEDRGPVTAGPQTFLQDVAADAVAVTASMVKQVGKLMTATSVVATATLAAVKVKLQAMTATTVVVTASMVKQVNKIMTATASAVTASIRKQVNKTLTATAVAVTATLSAIRVFLKSMTATSVVVTASMVRQVGKPLVATSVVVTASIVKQVNKLVRATNVAVTASLSAIRVFLKTMTATAVVVTASMGRRVNTALNATVAVTASVVKQISHRLTATATVTASLVATFVGPIVGPFKALISLIENRGVDVTATDTVSMAVTAQDATGATVTATDTTGADVTVDGATGVTVRVEDINT